MKNSRVPCPQCNDEGVAGGCDACGAVKYITLQESTETAGGLSNAEVPKYYLNCAWDIHLAKKKDDSESVKKILDILNHLIVCSNSGTLPDNSYAVLLPKNHGKRIAMFTMIINYQRRGLWVAPVIDVAAFNILANRNKYEDQNTMLSLYKADIAFIYGTDFITRRASLSLFRSLCSTRALYGKPAILFGDRPYAELSMWSGQNISLANNTRQEDHMANPYILDGVSRRV
jgi:hypothetical protein